MKLFSLLSPIRYNPPLHQRDKFEIDIHPGVNLVPCFNFQEVNMISVNRKLNYFIVFAKTIVRVGTVRLYLFSFSMSYVENNLHLSSSVL